MFYSASCRLCVSITPGTAAGRELRDSLAWPEGGQALAGLNCSATLYGDARGWGSVRSAQQRPVAGDERDRQRRGTDSRREGSIISANLKSFGNPHLPLSSSSL